MGMFFLFGIRTKSKAINQIQYPCSNCKRATVFTAMESKRWFTLFFIPVIPLGGNFPIRCNLCGLTLKCSPELKEQITAKAMAAGA
jgi:zinc-ribbon family